jgi:hypothetical protein
MLRSEVNLVTQNTEDTLHKETGHSAQRQHWVILCTVHSEQCIPLQITILIQSEGLGHGCPDHQRYLGS